MTGTTDRTYLRGNETIPQNRVGPRVKDPSVHYLITFDTTRDNIPVTTFDFHDVAVEWIKANPPYHPDGPKNNLAAPEVREAEFLAGFGYAEVHGYSLWHFRDNKPYEREVFYVRHSETDPVVWENDEDVE